MNKYLFLLQKLKSKNVMMQLFLHFLNVVAIFRIWSSGKKKPYLKCVVPFSNIDN